MIGVPGLWHLGDYNPFPLACWIIAGPTCIPLPAYGVMGKVGTNYSGGAGGGIQAP